MHNGAPQSPSSALERGEATRITRRRRKKEVTLEIAAIRAYLRRGNMAYARNKGAVRDRLHRPPVE